MAALLVVFITFFTSLYQISPCTTLFKEKVFKFHEECGNKIGFTTRPNKLKLYVEKCDMDLFYKTYREIYEQIKFFDKKFDGESPYYRGCLIRLKEMV